MIWKIRAGTSERYWKYWDEKDIISIGWDVGNLDEINWDETKKKIESIYSDKNPGLVTGKIRTFADVRESDDENMRMGNKVVILGEGTVLGVAEVGEYKYVPEGIPENETHTYQRKVEYLFKGRVRVRDLPKCFCQGGEYSLHLPSTLMKYESANDEIIENLIEELNNSESVETNTNFFLEFSETSLQEYIESNYDELDEDIVELEREYQTAVGNADFKCITKNGDILVIETKIGTADDSAVGQILGYMNSIKTESKDKKIRGLIISEGFSPRVKVAVSSLDISLKKFRAKLEFKNEE